MTMRCRNCGQPILRSAVVCPNCGAAVRRPPGDKRLTGVDWLDVLLGFGLVVLLLGILPWGGWRFLPRFIGPLYGSPLLSFGVLLAVYFAIRDSYSAFATGLKTGLILVLVLAGIGVLLLLGLLALCLAGGGPKW